MRQYRMAHSCLESHAVSVDLIKAEFMHEFTDLTRPESKIIGMSRFYLLFLSIFVKIIKSR